MGAPTAGDSVVIGSAWPYAQDATCDSGEIGQAGFGTCHLCVALQESGLGEFLGGSFQRMSLLHLYRASDQLVKHRDEIESKVFRQAMSLFGLACTVTLFGLTNTYLEGSAVVIPGSGTAFP